jgi:hypothetical protein
MEIANLAWFPANAPFEADLALVGGDPAGLTIAREFFGISTRVLVLESDLLDETRGHAALNEVESIGEPHTSAPRQKKDRFSRRKFVDMVSRRAALRRPLPGQHPSWAGASRREVARPS